MKTIGKRDVIVGLLQNLSDDFVRPDEFTVGEYMYIAKQEGRTILRKRAAEILNKLAEDGVLEKRKACVDARIVNIYRKK
jgi:hypothetical protein